MTTETNTKQSRSGFFKKKSEGEPKKQAAKPVETAAEETKYEPNPATAEARATIFDASRAAAYAAEAVVPKDTRNRPAAVRKARQAIAEDAIGDLIADGKLRLPDRPRTHTEHAQRGRGQMELS